MSQVGTASTVSLGDKVALACVVNEKTILALSMRDDVVGRSNDSKTTA